MTKLALVPLALLAFAACNKSSSLPAATPAPAAAATKVASDGSLCGEIAAAIADSGAGFPGWADKQKPAKSWDDNDGFESTRVLPGALSCAIINESSPAYVCQIAPESTPAEISAVLKSWEPKLDACPALTTAPWKKMTLGPDAREWGDQKRDGEHTVSLANSGKDDAKPSAVIVVRYLP